MRIPLSFWFVSAVLLLWGLGGVAIYIAYFIETPDQFARRAETAANQEQYAGYVANIPWWAIAVGIGAAVTRLLGAIALLLRRVAAVPLFAISALLFAIAVFRAFVVADLARVMSGPHIATEAVFLALSIFAVWFAQRSKRRRVLR